MTRYYVLTISRSSSFLLERRFSMEGINCEITYIPRELTSDLCNMGLRFYESEFSKAINVIQRSGLPGCKVFMEILDQYGSRYQEVPI